MNPSGEDILALGRTRLGEKYFLGALVPKDDGNWHGPWDCAEFGSWLVYQVGGALFGCADNLASPRGADAYTGFWHRDALRFGRMISPSLAAGIAGAMVLRVGINIGHLVVADGRGGTVEAHSAARGVTAETLDGRRWTCGILVPGIAYREPGAFPVLEPAPPIYRLIWPHLRGRKIAAIQTALGVEADGIFGPATHNAVLAFQWREGLVVDGEVGPQTLHALGVS